MDIIGIQLPHITKLFDNITIKLTFDVLTNLNICKNIIIAIKEQNIEEYKKQYDILNIIYEKNKDYIQRNCDIEQIAHYAPDWAEAIKNRIEIHGSSQLPENIEDA